MRTQFFCLGVSLSLGFSSPAAAQTVLAIDIQDRTNSLAALPMAGFDSFVINSVGNDGLVQTGTVTRTFGGVMVSLSGAGANPGCDDRQRTVPTNNPVSAPGFTQELLLRDFVFSRDVGSGGLDAAIDGLMPDQAYNVTVWSFDNGTAGGRTSDWSANGVVVKENYFFNGSVLPTTDAQYQFSFNVTASPAGRILIQGRRDASNPINGLAVFLNALKVEIGAAEPPWITADPVGSEIYAGDNTFLAVALSGTAPFWFQWYKDGGEVTDATNATLALFNAQVADGGAYTLVVTNVVNSVTSSPAVVVVRPVVNLTSGLLAHWALDRFNGADEFIPDLTANANDLAPFNMNIANVVEGRIGTALALFAGSIDDVHVWRRSLTEEEVRTVMDRVRILSFSPGGATAVISYVTSTPMDMHRVQEKENVTNPWNDTVGVVFASTGPNTFTATFPAPGGGQKFYRVVTP